MKKMYSLILFFVIMLLTACKSNEFSKETLSVNDVLCFDVDGDSDSDIENPGVNISSDDCSDEFTDSNEVTVKELSIKDEFVDVLGKEPVDFYYYDEYNDWFDMYSSIAYNLGKYDSSVYYLTYIDQDEIPELVIRWNNFTVWTWDGSAKNQFIGERMAYCEYSGKILTTEKDMDGNKRIIGYIYNKDSMTEEISINEDSEGEYEILGLSLNQNSYDIIKNFIDLEKIIYLSYDNCYSQVEILSVMKTGHDSSYTHSYEVIYEDVTWEEAQEICNEKGGYLAVITSQEELNRIKGLFSGREEIAVCYIGCKGTYSDNSIRWYLKNGNTVEIEGGHIYVFSYDTKCGVYCVEFDYENELMDYGFLVYGKIRNDDIDYDVEMLMGPSDIAKSNPELSGKVGFICEYDE